MKKVTPNPPAIRFEGDSTIHAEYDLHPPPRPQHLSGIEQRQRDAGIRDRLCLRLCRAPRWRKPQVGAGVSADD